MKCLLIIPSFKPTTDLISLIDQIHSKISIPIVIVNDGSPQEYDAIFDKVKKIDVTIIRNNKNLGKGGAIRAGAKYGLEHFPNITHFAFCDDDGQHSPDDVVKVINEAIETKNEFVIGSRVFDEKTPAKSLIGNRITSILLKTLRKIDIPDSQSGLRCFSRRLTNELLSIPGDYFGFELQTILHLYNKKIKVKSIPIRTIYFQNNRHTRFRPLRDSLMIILIILKSNKT